MFIDCTDGPEAATKKNRYQQDLNLAGDGAPAGR
jgi:hypothetical protein